MPASITTLFQHWSTIYASVTVGKFELGFTRYWNNSKTVGNFTVINSLQSPQESGAKEMYLHLKTSSVSHRKR